MKASAISSQTTYVLADEKAMGLLEVELQTEDGKDTHRFQIISVIRNDKQANYVSDLGSRLLYPNPPLNIISYMEHSVAELQEESTKDRNIIKEFLEQKERNSKIIANKSQFGPTYRVQRNGF